GLPNLANLRANAISHGTDVHPAGQSRHRPHRQPPRRTPPAAGSVAGRAALAVPLPPRVPGAARLDTRRFPATASPREGPGPPRAAAPAVAYRNCPGLRLFLVVRFLPVLPAAVWGSSQLLRPGRLAPGARR